MVPLPQVYYAMLAYQKKNKVINKCVSNAQFYYDCVRHNHPELKPKVQAVIALTKKGESVIHLVVRIGGQPVDPSYDILSSGVETYFENWADFRKVCAFSKIIDDKGNIKNEKWYVKTFLEFLGFADRINKGELLIVDKEYYHSQADWVKAMDTMGKLGQALGISSKV
jgi:hypothetical protein